MLFLTAHSPCSLHYLFLERWEQAEVPLLLFSNLVQRGQLSKGQSDNEDCLYRLLWSEVTNRQTWDGDREDGRVQTGFLHTWDGHLFQICWSLGVTYWSAHRLTLGITNNHSEGGLHGLLMQKGWAGIQLWLKKHLLAILDEQRIWPTCCCLCLLEEAALPSPEGNGSWNHWCQTRGRIQHSSLSQMYWEVCLIS